VNKCKCGSTKFVTTITLEIHNVPVSMLKNDSLRYDDTKGDSQGWDTFEQPEINCAACGHTYHLERIEPDTKGGLPRYELKDMEV
jgi:hypothetical protein